MKNLTLNKINLDFNFNLLMFSTMRSLLFALGFIFVFSFVYGQDCSGIEDIKSDIQNPNFRKGKVTKLKAKLKKKEKEICGGLRYADYKSNRDDGTLCDECEKYHRTYHQDDKNALKNRRSFNQQYKIDKPIEPDRCTKITEKVHKEAKEELFDDKDYIRCKYAKNYFFSNYASDEAKSCKEVMRQLDDRGGLYNEQCTNYEFEINKDEDVKTIIRYSEEVHELISIDYRYFKGSGIGKNKAEAMEDAGDNIITRLAKALAAKVVSINADRKFNEDEVKQGLRLIGTDTETGGLSTGLYVKSKESKMSNGNSKVETALSMKNSDYEKFKKFVIDNKRAPTIKEMEEMGLKKK